MFNDKYGLTDAVLQRRKTMTRRIVPESILRMAEMEAGVCGGELESYIKDHTFYCFGEVVAIAQSYKDCWDIYQKQWEARNNPSDWHTPDAILGDQVQECKGWANKMFVRADLMPNRIRITGIKVERLQDISNEDCLKEGVFHYFQPPFNHEYDRYAPWPPCIRPYKHDIDNLKYFSTAQAAFAHLIDRISGRGTWNSNPWVYAYEYEVVS